MIAAVAGWAAAWAGPEVEAVDVNRGALADRLAPADDATLVLLYSAEQDGEIGPCGCDVHPTGGLPWLAAYRDAVREARPDVPVLLVNAGGYLASTPDSDGDDLLAYARDTNLWFHRALSEIQFDALNVGFRDLAGTVPASHPGQVSVSHRSPGVPVARYKTFDLDGLRVVVTGASRAGLRGLEPAGTAVTSPLAGVRAVLPEILATGPGDPLVVVLLFDAPRDAEPIARLPGVDVVIEAGGYAERWPPVAVGDAVWVRSRAAGSRVGELRLWVEDGRVVRAVDRAVILDAGLRPDRRLEALQRGQAAGR